MSLYICPLCGENLKREFRSYRCRKGHCYDISSSGYVHLLPVGQKHSKMPGDDKGMAVPEKIFCPKDITAICWKHFGTLPVVCAAGKNRWCSIRGAGKDIIPLEYFTD